MIDPRVEIHSANRDLCWNQGLGLLDAFGRATRPDNKSTSPLTAMAKMRAAATRPSGRFLEGRLPRIWIPDGENRDVRQLLWHRHRLVQMRTRVVNQLHAVALNEGVRRKKALWRSGARGELEALVLAPWSSWRRKDLLALLDRLEPTIASL
jgi:transposase